MASDALPPALKDPGGIEGFIHRRGRKFFLGLWISTLATTTALIGIGATRAEPDAGPHIAVILGALAGVYATVAAMFGYADAKISTAAIVHGATVTTGVPSSPSHAPARGSAAVVAPGDA